MAKKFNIIRYLQRHPQGQHGAVLLVMLVILIMGGTAMLLNALNSNSIRLERDQITADALAQAKEALIGYAVTYGDRYNNVNGFLPCPDQGQNVTKDGTANTSCSTTNVSLIGKFPWKTLGLSPLQDGNGECLWYLTSGTYKNDPDTYLMNWDNNGLFKIISSDGVSTLAGSSTINQPVAVIFSPGPAIGSQDRTNSTNTPSCGGNYTASNYLDNDTIHGINNALISTTANTVIQLESGPAKDISGNLIVNDRLLIITKDEIFNAIKKRNDFSTFVNSDLLSSAVTVTCLEALPNPTTVNFDTMNAADELAGVSVGTGINKLITGHISISDCTDTSNISIQKWRDNLAYAKCSTGSSSCLSVNGTPCKGIIIFTGERSTTQNRISNTQKNDWNNYLEGEALSIFTSGASPVTGVSTTYDPTTPTKDIWRCIS